MKRDPIMNKPANGSGATKRPDGNRDKAISGSGPSFTKGNEDLNSFPVPNSPYAK